MKNFTEKPDVQTAEKFLAEGNYLWNAGIFIWSVKSILNSFESSLPTMYSLFQKGASCWNTNEEDGFIEVHYPKAENISIDYGIMEKATNVYVMATDFGWNDLGTWGSLYDKLSKDDSNNAIVNAKAYFMDAENNMVSTQSGKRIIISGISDYIVVETKDTIMIYPKSEEQQIKQVSKKVDELYPDN